MESRQPSMALYRPHSFPTSTNYLLTSCSYTAEADGYNDRFNPVINIVRVYILCSAIQISMQVS
jgi:hypothetical protein